MISLPLPCKIVKTTVISLTANIREFKVNNIKHTKGITPNLLNESLLVEYGNLNMAELAGLEVTFDYTKGTVRVLHLDKRWLLDGYQVEYKAPYKLSLTLLKVG